MQESTFTNYDQLPLFLNASPSFITDILIIAQYNRKIDTISF